MSSVAAQAQGRNLIALIADEDTATGLLLAGIGHVAQSDKEQGQQSRARHEHSLHDSDRSGQAAAACHERNFFIVNNATGIPEIESAFTAFTQERSDIAILLITQPLAEKIRQVCDAYQQAFPALLEIPSKDSPYGELSTWHQIR